VLKLFYGIINTPTQLADHIPLLTILQIHIKLLRLIFLIPLQNTIITLFFFRKSNIENKFGAHFTDLDREQKIRLKISGGAIIKFIFENSLAFNSKLLEGDIITHIQNHKVVDVNDLDSIINNKLDYSKNIEVLYLRDGIKGKDIIKNLLNKKPF